MRKEVPQQKLRRWITIGRRGPTGLATHSFLKPARCMRASITVRSPSGRSEPWLRRRVSRWRPRCRSGGRPYRIGRNVMNNTMVKILAIASVLGPAAAFAQAAKAPPTTATYIMKGDVDKIGATEQSVSVGDENVKIVDLGYENFAVGIIHRGSTRTPTPAGGGGAVAAQAQACGRTMATLPQGGTPGGITHDLQTEGYYITSGGGT